MKGYEAHLTFGPEHDEELLRCVGYGWKFSKIDGDPVLGPGVKMYLTAHSSDLRTLQKEVEVMVKLHKPRRSKIELILQDDFWDKP